MVKRCIGIDISPSHLRAVQISRTGEKFCIEKVFGTQTRRSEDSPSEILRSLTSRFGFDRHADVAISMPNDTVFFKNLETDFATLGQLRTGNFSLLEHNFPIQPDEIVGQVCSYRRLPEAENWSVLAAAVARASLHETLETLAGAKMHPHLVDAPIFAIHAAVVVNHPEIMTGRAIIAYIDESHLVLAVTSDGEILIVRNIPIVAASDSSSSPEERSAAILACEAHVSWQRVFGTDIGQEIKIYLVTADACEYLQSLIEENLHCQATIVDPYARVEAAADCLVWAEPAVARKADLPVCVAEGLALRVLGTAEILP